VRLAKLGAPFRGHGEDDYLKIKDMFIFNLRFTLFCFGLKIIEPFLRIFKFRHTKNLGHAPPLHQATTYKKRVKKVYNLIICHFFLFLNIFISCFA